MLLVWLLDRIELTHIHLVGLLWECLESVLLLLRHHAGRVCHEWIRLLALHGSERILAHGAL